MELLQWGGRYSEAQVDELIKSKMLSGSWMWHPDWDGHEDQRLYKVFDMMEESTTDEFEQEAAISMVGDIGKSSVAMFTQNGMEGFAMPGLVSS